MSDAAFVDVSSAEPRVVVGRGVRAYPAARSASGRWLVVAGDGPDGRAVLRSYDGLTAAARDEPGLPFGRADLAPLEGRLSDVERRIEAGPGRAIEQLLFVGDVAVAVPYLVGLPNRERPWVLTPGGWREEASLHPFTSRRTDWKRPPCAKGVRLGDGADVLLWDGVAYEWEGDRFARRFAHDFGPAPWFRDWEPVPSGNDGFFYLRDATLVEARRDARDGREHLRGLRVRAMGPGPDDSILLTCADAVLLYDPRAETLARVPPELSGGDDARFVAWAEGGLVAGVGSPLVLALTPAAEVRALRPEHAADVVAALSAPTAPVVAPMAGGFASSRPRAAARGQHVFIATGAEVRGHALDAPRWRRAFEADVVAIALGARGLGVLTSDGTLHVLEPASGSTVRAGHVAPGPRSLAAEAGGEHFAVLAASDVWVIDDGGSARRAGFDVPVAASFEPEGSGLLVLGQNRRSARVALPPGGGTPVVSALPIAREDLHAVAHAAGGVVALGSQGLYVLDEATGVWRPYDRSVSGAHLSASPSGSLLAWQPAAQAVAIAAPGAVSFAAVARAAYPATYSTPADEPLEITGLAFLDENRLAVALTDGRANVLAREPHGALKLGGFPGDASSRWVFVYDGRLLVAS